MSEVKAAPALPFGMVKSISKNPKSTVIFSKPKVGKTSLFAQLPNSLILDFESGTDYVDAVKVGISSISELWDVAAQIAAAGHPYKVIIADTCTALEDLCIPYAEDLYSRSSMGANWFKPKGGKELYGSIINMPNGAGYMWLRQAFDNSIQMIKGMAPHVILACHVKDIALEKNDIVFNTLDLDLTGKIKRTTASKSDAIGYLYRKGKKNILSFKTSDEVSCGARPEHLRNKELVISEIAEDGTLITHWDQIFVD
jgi:hypothetical protein